MILAAVVVPSMLALAAPSDASATQLSLEQAVHAAVANNLDLLQQRLVARRAAALESASWWAFTPQVKVAADVADNRSAFSGIPGKSADSAVGLAWRTPIGTAVSAELQLARSFEGPSAHNEGALVLAVTQPLLQDAWLPGAAAPINEASYQARIAREGLRRELESFIVDVESAYWDLALAQADVDIKHRSLERARQQYADTAENIKRGILADVEIYLVDENQVFFEAELARAEEDRAQAKRRLAQLLWLEPEADVSVVEDLGGLRDGDSDQADLARSLEATLARSPALAEQRLRTELARSRERTAAVSALPKLDVDGSIALTGEGVPGHASVEQVFTSPAPDARVGLVFSMPLGPPAVRASVEAEHLEAERARLELEGRELKARHDVEGGVGELALSLKVEQLGEKQLALAGKKLAAQEDKYRDGISTLADVVRFQRELDEASIAQRRNVRAVHVARARLMELEGRLADAAGVEIK